MNLFCSNKVSPHHYHQSDLCSFSKQICFRCNSFYLTTSVFLLFIMGCRVESGSERKTELEVHDSLMNTQTDIPEKLEIMRVGNRISGDFNGDGIIEYACLVKTKQGLGNPVEEGTSDVFEILFSNSEIPAIPVDCCEFLLVYEGDLNGNGSDEFTMFQDGLNGCSKMVKTFTFNNDVWKELYDPFLCSVGCGVEVTDEEYLNWVVLENDTVYYRLPDLNEHLLNEEGDRIIFNRLLKIKADIN
ncbi:MAG: hypothetical protein GC181_07140 [Bacteroidetes bacterium]|nr:hypothetical protein [Bacteroidota bacterium]